MESERSCQLGQEVEEGTEGQNELYGNTKPRREASPERDRQCHSLTLLRPPEATRCCELGAGKD